MYWPQHQACPKIKKNSILKLKCRWRSCCNFYLFQTFFHNLYYIHRRTIKLIDEMPKSILKQLGNININIEEQMAFGKTCCIDMK